MSFGPPQPLGGPPLTAGYGGGCAHALDLYPEGFACGSFSDGSQRYSIQSTDGGKTLRRSEMVIPMIGLGFAIYTDPSSGKRWAHNYGPATLLSENTTSTSVSSNSSSAFGFQNSNLTYLQNGTGPGVSFTGLPRPLCQVKTRNFVTFYAGGHVLLPDGTHLQSGELVWCGHPFSGFATSLVAFRSKNGYDYEYAGNISLSLDLPRSSEGPNEHDMALLPNGDVLCVMRTGAGDGRGGYMPFYKTLSSDGGRTWSKPEVMPNIGCARPHLVQLGNVTILSGGRKMMGHNWEYDRSFDVWMSQDLGVTWEHASGSYEHNAKAHITKVPLFPEAVNRTGWRFQYSSGYIGLVRVGEASAMVIYDFSVAVGEKAGRHEQLVSNSTKEASEDFLGESLRPFHNPFFTFAMRIDVISQAGAPAFHVNII